MAFAGSFARRAVARAPHTTAAGRSAGKHGGLFGVVRLLHARQCRNPPAAVGQARRLQTLTARWDHTNWMTTRHPDAGHA
jgi:hypothetical protein